MHKEMTHKLEQKIHLLERSNKDKKEKASNLKYEVERLYEALQGQVKKEYDNNEAVRQAKEQNRALSQKNM